jgi:DNA-binding transcriptional LysR family regulator
MPLWSERRLMELAHLEAFLAAAERGSFRRAAEALHLSQPSLSARVHALEEELGVPLFHRMGRGVRLTEMGKAFRPYTERAMEALRQGRDVIDTTRDASGGVLHIASARAIGTYTLPSILERFRQRYPSINVHISIGRSSNVLQMVVDEEVQLGLSRVLTHPDVVTIHLYDEDVCLATSPRHPFAIRGEASIYEVALEPLILYDRESSYFVLIDQVCREAGISPRVEMTLDSIEATKHLVELGMGISFLPRSGVRHELERGSLCLIPLKEGHLVSLPTSVMVRRAQYYNPTVLAFLNVLHDIYDADISLLEGKGVPANPGPLYAPVELLAE